MISTRSKVTQGIRNYFFTNPIAEVYVNALAAAPITNRTTSRFHTLVPPSQSGRNSEDIDLSMGSVFGLMEATSAKIIFPTASTSLR